MKKFIQYIKDVRAELAKVSWPSREELTGATMLVIMLSIVVAIMVKGFDFFLTKIFSFILNI